VTIVNRLVESKIVDTFSRFRGTMAVIFPNHEIQTSSRWNLELAHELGHLVMHRNVRTGNKETEDAANSFARALLLPRGAFRSEFRELPFSWEHVFELKKHWGTSATTIVTRAYDLELLGAVQYRKAKKHISSKGWTKKEPHERRFQQSSLFEEALNELAKEAPITIDLQIEKFCQELFFTPATFRTVTRMEISSEHTQTPKLNTIDSRLPTAPLSPDQPDPEPEPLSLHGLDLVKQEAKGLFLLRGIENYELARDSGPRGWALGIERWHPEYLELPAFKMAERFWVVINRSDDREDNQRFVKSISADKSIHERTRISTVNNVHGMIALFQWVSRDVGSRMFFQWIFEDSWHFEPIPLLSHTNKLADLIEPLVPPEPKPVDRGPFYGRQW
jgi:Zn-dependent peptidase ImmA (M78 family)